MLIYDHFLVIQSLQAVFLKFPTGEVKYATVYEASYYKCLSPINRLSLIKTIYLFLTDRAK